ncbi:MAG: DUF2341 domain-containing protein [Kiritimatiellae bacterium]|nr:DUF2341 domain-containing protein [Kiritimatiellia bacterium]
MQIKHIIASISSVIVAFCIGMNEIYAAEADATGLVPVLSWDFDTKPNYSELNAANKGSLSPIFKNEGSTSYVEEYTGKYALDTSKFTPYISSSNPVSVPTKTGLTLSMLMTLGSNSTGITFNFRTGSGDVIIRRGASEGTLVVAFGSAGTTSTQFINVSVPNGDTEYFMFVLLVEETGMTVYIDGEIAASTTEFTAWHNSQLLNVLQFGSHYGGTQTGEKKYGGYIGDLRIYDDVLTKQQIDLLAIDLDQTNNISFQGTPKSDVVGSECSIEYAIKLYETKTAEVAVVYDTNPEFSSPTTEVVESAAQAGAYVARLQNLNPGTTYYYKLTAKNETYQIETLVSSFKTAPIVEPSKFIKRIEIKVPGYTGESVLKNFPVLVKLSEEAIPGFKYEDCFIDGSDVVFAQQDNLVLYHEIESWNSNGESYIWVRIPELSGQETKFYLYYGVMNAEALPNIDPKDVWIEYAAVFHGGESIYDATGNAAAIVENGVVGAEADGIAGGVMTKAATSTIGLQFSNPVLSGALNSISKLSISGWFKKTQSGAGVLAANKNAWSDAGFLAIDEKTYFSVAVSSTHQGEDGKCKLTSNTWGHIAFTYENTHLKSYLNGVQEYEKTDAKYLSDLAQTYWAFGSYSAKSSDSFSGSMDELRVYNGIASVDWVKAEYDSIANASTFVEVQDVVDLNTGLPVIATPSISSSSNGSITITAEVSAVTPDVVNCIVAGQVFEMTADVENPLIYTAIVSGGIASGTYTARVQVISGENSVEKISKPFYFGAFSIEVLANVDEENLTPGLFRIHREAIGAELSEFSFICSFSGDGMASTTLPESMEVVFPTDALYVDIPVEAKYSEEIDQDSTVVMTVSGSFVSSSSSQSMTIYNLVNNVFVQYVSPDGNDANRAITSDSPKKTLKAAMESLNPFMGGSNPGTIYLSEGLYVVAETIHLTNAISIVGVTGNPCDVVVSNKTEASYYATDCRVFILGNSDASVSSLTMKNGQSYYIGGNFYISENGGMISNCVVEAGYTRDNGQAGGGALDAGIVTHTIFRKNTSSAGSVWWDGIRAGVLRVNNSAKVENCLFENNNQYASVELIIVNNTAVFRNNTIVNNILSKTNDTCTVWSALRISGAATVENNLISAITVTQEGGVAKVRGTPANFKNGAIDYEIGEEDTIPATTIIGTPEMFFTDYAAGNYCPRTGGILSDKGVNYEGMALYDLSGKRDRLIGSRVDIGCYEGIAAGTLFIVK